MHSDTGMRFCFIVGISAICMVGTLELVSTQLPLTSLLSTTPEAPRAAHDNSHMREKTGRTTAHVEHNQPRTTPVTHSSVQPPHTPENKSERVSTPSEQSSTTALASSKAHNTEQHKTLQPTPPSPSPIPRDDSIHAAPENISDTANPPSAKSITHQEVSTTKNISANGPDTSSSETSEPHTQQSDPTETRDSSHASLATRAVSHGISFGAMISYPLFLEGDYRTVAQTEFDGYAPGGETLMSFVQSSRGSFDFDRADAIYEFAEETDASVYPNHLVWHSSAGTPSWVRTKKGKPDELGAILQTHIETTVSHFTDSYPNTSDYWIVVNEALPDIGPFDAADCVPVSGNQNTGFTAADYGIRGHEGCPGENIWADIPDYIHKSFVWAHDADPNAHLYYNDYGISGGGREKDEYTYWIGELKFQQLLHLMEDLIAHKTPIDGVGFQMHITEPWGAPSKATLKDRFARLAALGLDVRITELQVYIENADGVTNDELDRQADIYRDVVEACIESHNCTGVTTWCISDAHSWVPTYVKDQAAITAGGAACLFDTSFTPKPAYHAVQKAFE